MFPVLHHTRASCAAQRTAEELYGGTGAPRRTVFAAITALAVVAVTACSDDQSSDALAFAEVAESEAVDPSLRFEGSVGTTHDLGVQVLAALAVEDRNLLQVVRLTEYEHNEVVWPELPASAPEINFPVDYAWENIQNRNRRGLERLLPHFKGKDLSLQSVECRGERQDFETFHVETDCWLVYTSGTSPELWEVQAFKDVLVRGGGRKLFRYYDEEPRPYRGAGTS